MMIIYLCPTRINSVVGSGYKAVQILTKSWLRVSRERSSSLEVKVLPLIYWLL